VGVLPVLLLDQASKTAALFWLVEGRPVPTFPASTSLSA